MSGYVLVVTFVVSGYTGMTPAVWTGTVTPASNLTVYTTPRPTDYAIVKTIPADSLDAAMVVYASVEPEGIFGAGWYRGPAVVIELATGKVTRLKLVPKFVTKTATVTVQQGWTAEVEP